MVGLKFAPVCSQSKPFCTPKPLLTDHDLLLDWMNPKNLGDLLFNGETSQVRCVFSTDHTLFKLFRPITKLRNAPNLFEIYLHANCLRQQCDAQWLHGSKHDP